MTLEALITLLLQAVQDAYAAGDYNLARDMACLHLDACRRLAARADAGRASRVADWKRTASPGPRQ